MATATDYAWAAGFFDGEGCVSLGERTRRPGQTYPGLSVIVVQKDRRALDQFYAIFNSTEKISVVTRTHFKRPYYRLSLSGNRAVEVLTAMLPYLTVKREVALVGLALQQSINEHSRSVRASGLPAEVLEYRRSLIVKAKWLNTGRWAAATTKSRGSAPTEAVTGCDSLVCNDDKVAEAGRNDQPHDRLTH